MSQNIEPCQHDQPSKRSYSQIQSTTNKQPNPNDPHPSKRAKQMHAKPMQSPPSAPPSISISGSSSYTNTQSHSHSHSHTPSIPESKRNDLFDDHLDQTYAFTKPTSTIPPPTLGNVALENVWRDKTERALLTFQRRNKTNQQLQSEKEPNNPIMKLLLRQSVLECDESTIIGLQNCVLTLIYSSQSQQKQLQRSRNRWNKWNRNNNNNNNTNHMYHYDVSWYEKLPGPQPHSITRQNLDRLRSYYYWVAEKSDGVRFQLLLSNSPLFEAYFVGRKFEFYRILHPFYKKFLNNVNGPSLMDGELIVNNSNELEYLIFDCVAMRGKSLSNECTSRRVEAFEHFIAKYANDIKCHQQGNHKDQYSAPPILLRAKKHYKAQDIGLLLGQISCFGDGEYYFENSERKTKNDGLIFTPQENNYLMSYDPGALVKWKFLEKNTIDLKVKTPYIWRGKLDLFAGGKGSSDVLFTQSDMNKMENRNKFNALLSEMSRLSNHRNGFVSSFIIECAWNFKDKEWELIQNRPDKHIPNFITVCTDTLRVMMDNVSKFELIDACKPIMAKPTQDYNTNYQMNNGANSNNYSQYR